jgi:DNA-binding CsgD family transcriptional regulator
VLFGFTVAEAEVCRLMMLGLSSGEVAERRSVAEGTIKAQFRSIYAKTSVHRRVDLIRLALTVDPPIM